MLRVGTPGRGRSASLRVGNLLHERPVVVRRVDAECRLVDHPDQDGVARLEDAKLFEFFDLLQLRRRHRRQLQQELAAVGVQADVLIERRRTGRQQPIVPVPWARDHAAAEIERPAVAVEDHLHAGRVVQLPPVADGRGQRAHHRAGILFEQFDGQVDGGPGNLRLVALHVHDDIDAADAPGDLGHAICAAGRTGIGHVRLAAERKDLVVDFGTVGGDADSGRPGGPARSLVGMLQQRLAGPAQQQFTG